MPLHGVLANTSTTQARMGVYIWWKELCICCCCRVNLPASIELAMAGVCAAILVAACQDTAAQLLMWPGRPRPAAIAITGEPRALVQQRPQQL